jgi:NADP-dependent 3-hydroxy acid dehydrogenase YdfG
MPSIAIFGAGPAFGASVARRFHAAGYDVALVARDPAKLAPLAEETGASTHLAELTDRAQVLAALDAIGLTDVVVWSPGDVSRLPVAALDLDAETLETWLPLHLLSPLALGHAVVPEMVERGSGTFVVAQGVAASRPDPMLASVGAPQAALRNWLDCAAQLAEPRGVKVAALEIAELIERSAAARLFDQGHFEGVEDGALPRIDPDALADRVWNLHETLARSR